MGLEHVVEKGSAELGKVTGVEVILKNSKKHTHGDSHVHDHRPPGTDGHFQIGTIPLPSDWR